MDGAPRYECALITGASAGLGEEFAMQLAPQCRRIVLVARREEVLRQLETKMRIEHPELGLASLALDLTLEAERRELIDRLAGTKWEPGLLVNNAGAGDHGEFATGDWEKLHKMISLNVSALTHLAHGFLPGMLETGQGSIINVSSLASLLPIPDFGVYAATKAYVTSFSEALRMEVRPNGVSVLAVCPGPVHTEFGAVARRSGEQEETPTREWFFVEKELVVARALAALRADRARVYPGWRVAMLAAVISLAPLAVVRYLMGKRPRRMKEDAKQDVQAC